MPGSPITSLSKIIRSEPVAAPPRAQGSAFVSVARREARSELRGLRQSGSLKLLFPRCDRGPLQAVLVNTAGGVTGGDCFELRAEAQKDTALTLTTQAAERAYRAAGPQRGRIETRLSVAKGAQLNWLPQETILFDGCALDRRLRADLADGAGLLLVETLVFGRAAMGERVTAARFSDRIELRRAGRLLHLDAMRFDGDVAGLLDRPGIAGGAGAVSSVVLVRPDAAGHLDPIRAALPDTGGASLVGDDMLLIRLLATDGFELRQTLVPILNRLTKNSLPRPWMI